tara:strand:- start:54 stop:542 length:489 start_codon:yes stop_codon:yes gene_type:complete
MIVSKEIKNRGTYLGYFTVGKKIVKERSWTALLFTEAPGMKRRDYIAMGDIVYGMYVLDSLEKIGKAGGGEGWYSRANTYAKNPVTESTNAKILRVMQKEFKPETKIEVYGFSVPKAQSEYFCSITNQTLHFEVEQHEKVEKHLTKEALNQDEDLRFCTQLN